MQFRFRFRMPVTLHGVLAIALLSCTAGAQSFNIDMDVPTASPALGGGVPSSSYGAASGQAGVWNSYPATSNPINLVGLNGAATSATLQITATSTTPSVLAFNNASNTGDFALLFNDGSQIGTVLQGGSRTYQFSGLTNGVYQLYTYGSPPQPGNPGEVLVNVPGSLEGTQAITGPHAPNTFAYGVTHVIHNVTVTDGTLIVHFTDNPGSPSAYVSGFQLVIPSPGTLAISALACLNWRRRRHD